MLSILVTGRCNFAECLCPCFVRSYAHELKVGLKRAHITSALCCLRINDDRSDSVDFSLDMSKIFEKPLQLSTSRLELVAKCYQRVAKSGIHNGRNAVRRSLLAGENFVIEGAADCLTVPSKPLDLLGRGKAGDVQSCSIGIQAVYAGGEGCKCGPTLRATYCGRCAAVDSCCFCAFVSLCRRSQKRHTTRIAARGLPAKLGSEG